jgi:hypothetical protein
VKCAAEMASYGLMYIQSFKKIGAGAQAILRFFFLMNLRGCNVLTGGT